MRIDHIAYRTADRNKTVQFFINAFDYKIQTEFDINFDDGSTAKCIALEPPEKKIEDTPWVSHSPTDETYHMAPEIFVSDGSPDSIVGKWVAARNGVGGIHHIAYQVDSVGDKMKEWKEKGYAEFTTDEPLTCPDLCQCFTKPSELTGVIYEFIERGKHGFCAENVQQLMLSTDNL
jgi:4-hydroxyphenylpyruvate dioxygenase-like putative hemolysin